MKSRVMISGMSQLSALGQGQAALREGLRKQNIPLLKTKAEMTQTGPREVLIFSAPEPALPEGFPENRIRRLSRVARMFLVTALEAMNEAFAQAPRKPDRLGLVVGTGFSTLQPTTEFQRSFHLQGPIGISPTLFSSSVQNSIAAQLSMIFEIQGPTSTVMTAEQTTINSLRLAYDWIQQDLADHVLVVIGDEICDYHTYALAHRPPSSAIDPSSDRCSTQLGEGVVAFVLSRASEETIGKKKVEISEIQIFSEQPPEIEQIAFASHGREGQFSKYKNWLEGKKIHNHSHLYGSMVTGLAFEIAIAALKVSEDRHPWACVQLTDHSEKQSLVLTPNVHY